MSQRPKISGYIRIIPVPEATRSCFFNPKHAALYEVRKESTSQLTIPFIAQGVTRPSSASILSYHGGGGRGRAAREAGPISFGEGRSLLSCQAIVGPDETNDWLYGEVLDWYLDLLCHGEDLHILAFAGTDVGHLSGPLPEPISFFFCSMSSLEQCFIARLLHRLKARSPGAIFTLSCQVLGYRENNSVVCLMPQQYITPDALLNTYCSLLIDVGRTMPTISTFNITISDESGSFIVTSTLKLGIIPFVGGASGSTAIPVLEEAIPGRGHFPRTTPGVGSQQFIETTSINHLSPSGSSGKSVITQSCGPTLAHRIKEGKCSRAERLGDIQVLGCHGVQSERSAVEVPSSIIHPSANNESIMTQISAAFAALCNRELPLLKCPFLLDLKDTFTGRVCTCVIGFVFQSAGRDRWTRKILSTVNKVSLVARNNNWAGPTTAQKTVTIDADELQMIRRAADRAHLLEAELNSLKHESKRFITASALDMAVLRTKAEALASQEAILKTERAYLAQKSKLLINQMDIYRRLEQNAINHCSCGTGCNSLSRCTCECSKRRACSSKSY
ncbi:hypothetical protein GL50803_0061271 [Giardia duodenalis]|uniref:Uncharacterized protein n=1 Tax=Giardia intestinalis (strain ATCC 50803 / WB clone C6) TaxID=184922 RepID=A0A644F026_GIAIC|nr:hypothetical protein GL50803_0061271 [Giardia intestinalis]KAE8301988.1 hypothetical protein GL50803_0061271 [Giardia intestinalis]